MSDTPPNIDQGQAGQAPPASGQPSTAGDAGGTPPPERPWDNPEVAQRVITDLRQEAAGLRSAKNDLQAKATKWDEAQAAAQTDLERAQAQVAELQKSAAELTLERDRLQVAQAKGIPAELMATLAGSTREELEANADTLAKALGAGAGGAPKNGRPREAMRTVPIPGAPTGGDPRPDMNAWMRGQMTGGGQPT